MVDTAVPANRQRELPWLSDIRDSNWAPSGPKDGVQKRTSGAARRQGRKERHEKKEKEAKKANQGTPKRNANFEPLSQPRIERPKEETPEFGPVRTVTEEDLVNQSKTHTSYVKKVAGMLFFPQRLEIPSR